jgi:hypothetical protein
MADRAFPTTVPGTTQHATTLTSPSATGLTLEGRLLLEERLQLLRATVAELADGLTDPERRADVVEGYHRASTELQRLQALVEAAGILDDLVDDPNRVDLGDRVSIRLEDGTEETTWSFTPPRQLSTTLASPSSHRWAGPSSASGSARPWRSRSPGAPTGAQCSPPAAPRLPPPRANPPEANRRLDMTPRRRAERRVGI